MNERFEIPQVSADGVRIRDVRVELQVGCFHADVRPEDWTAEPRDAMPPFEWFICHGGMGHGRTTLGYDALRDALLGPAPPNSDTRTVELKAFGECARPPLRFSVMGTATINYQRTPRLELPPMKANKLREAETDLAGKQVVMSIDDGTRVRGKLLPRGEYGLGVERDSHRWRPADVGTVVFFEDDMIADIVPATR